MISEKCIFNVCWHPNLSEIQHANYGSKYLQTRDATTEVHISRNCNTPRMCCYLRDTTIFFYPLYYTLTTWGVSVVLELQHAVTEV